MNFGGAVRINKCGIFLVGALAFLILLYAYSGQRSSSQSSSSLHLDNPYNQNTNKVSLRQLLIAAVDVATRGGLEVVQIRKSAAALEEKSKGKTKEGAKDPVTEGDFRSHRVMFFGLRKAFPGVRVISEEYTESPDMADVPLPAIHNDEITSIFTTDKDKTVDAEDVSVWIDPLDATQEYTENLVDYVTTMVGVAIKGVPIMGVIHRPFQGETFWAVVGYGNSPNLNSAVKAKASSNSIGENEKSKVNSPLRVIVSRSHKGKVYNMTSAALGHNKESFTIISAAGAGYKVLELVAGRADVYLHVTNIKKWDLCAGNGILNALGGEMVTINGEKLDYSSDTHPLNTKGIIAFTTQSAAIDKLREIEIAEN